MRIAHLAAGLAAALTLMVGPVLANEGFSGEGTLSAGYTSGNTETTDLGAGLKAAADLGVWTHKVELAADYGETEDVVSRNRLFGAYQIDRDLSERAYVYGRGSATADEFSGFDRRVFAGVGLGYRVLMSDATNWTVEAGPGYRWDDVARQGLTPARSEESVSARLGSRFKHAFSDAVAFSNDTEVNYAEVSTEVTNSAAITAKLSTALAARFSFDVRYDTDAPIGREDTDTTTRLSLVYGF